MTGALYYMVCDFLYTTTSNFNLVFESLSFQPFIAIHFSGGTV